MAEGEGMKLPERVFTSSWVCWKVDTDEWKTEL